MARGPIRVALVVQRELVRQGLRGMLTTFPSRTELVGEPSTPAAQLDCDVAIVDLDGSARSREAITALTGRGIPVVGVADGSGRAGRHRASAPTEVLSLDMSALDVLGALEEAAERHPRPSTSEAVVTAFDGRPWGLTGREVDVLALICRGFSNAELARQLQLSENSIKGYVRLAYRKVGVSRRSQAVLWCLEHGLDRGTAPQH